MKTKDLFFVFIMALVALMMAACSKIETEEFEKKPVGPEENTLEVIEASMYRNDNIKNSLTDWLNPQKSGFDAKVNSKTESFSEILPQNINWEAVPELTKNNLEIILINSNIGKITEENTKNANNSITTMKQDFGFDFIGFNLVFKTLNTKAVLEMNGKKANYLYSSLDSLTFDRFSKEERPTEKVTKDGIAYIRHFGHLMFNVFRTELPNKKKLSSEVIQVPVTILVPEIIIPGVDILEGMVKKGDGKLYWLKEETYRAEQEITMFYSESGKKDSTLVCDYVVKAWMQDKQDVKDITNIEIGNPKTTPTPVEETDNRGDFVYTKMTKTWDNVWTNTYTAKAYTLSERAKYVRGTSSIEMPYSDALLSFDNFASGNSVEISKNAKKYDRYANGVINFSWTYNKDQKALNYAQVFDIEQGIVTITSIVKNGEGTLTHVRDNEWLSEQPIITEWSDGRKENTTLSYKLYKTVTMPSEQILTLASPQLNFSKANKVDSNGETKEDGKYFISNIKRTTTFTYTEGYAFNVVVDYQTLVWKEGAFTITMPSSESVLSHSTYSYDKNSTEISKDGKNYLRYQGTSAIKEAFNKEEKALNQPVKIDVLKTADELVGVEEITGTGRLFKTPGMDNMYTSEIRIKMTYKSGATKDSLLSVNLNVHADTPIERTLFLNNYIMTWMGDNFPTAIPTSRTEGAFVINNYRKEYISSYTNNFNYSIFAYYDIAVWNKGKFIINMPSATMNINYLSQASVDNGVGSDGQINYNQTQFTFKHAVTYNGDNWEVSVPLKVNVIKKFDDNTPNGSIDVDATKKYGGITKSWNYNNVKSIIASVIYKEGIEIYVNGKVDGFYTWDKVGRPETFVDPSTNLVSAIYDQTTGKWIPSSIATNANGNWDYIGKISGREVVRQVDKALAILDLDKTPYLKYGRDFVYRADGAVVIAYDNWTLVLSID